MSTEAPPGPDGHGRMDLYIDDTCIEFKKEILRNGIPIPENITQLDGYLEDLLKAGSGVRSGILTDGIHYFLRRVGEERLPKLHQTALSTFDHADQAPCLREYLYGTISAPAENVSPTAENLERLFGSNSDVFWAGNLSNSSHRNCYTGLSLLSEGNVQLKLTESQEEAVKYNGRNLQLIACAGSGKTEVVAQRVAHLLTKKGEGRLEPRNIVAFTFTEKAAAELKERIMQRTRAAAGLDIIGMVEMYVGTIHGFCQDLLQNEVPEYRKYAVLDSIRQILYVNRNSQRTGLTTSKNLEGESLIRWRDTGQYLTALAMLREDEVNRHKLDDCSVAQGLDKYRSQLSDDSFFDFTSMLENAVSELETNDTLRTQISERVKYVVVDEYQDVNPIQERLVKLLHDLGAGLCVVGDDDQTIYQWRGSWVENILKFKENYPHVNQIRLEENFRSSEGVIDAARRFIGKVSPRLEKEMKFADAQTYENGDIVALQFNSPQEEAKYIAESIKSLRGVAFTEGNEERGLSWSDMAVLLRSVRGSGVVITDALKGANIPFVVKGLANLFETYEAHAARSLFHYITGETVRAYGMYSVESEVAPDLPALRRAWERAALGLTKRNLTRALKYVKEVHDKLVDGPSGDSPSIQRVFLTFLELAEVREETVPDGMGQVVLFNLGRFSKVIADWEAIYYNSNPFESFQGFANFLYNQADGEYGEGAEDNDYLVPDAVQIMTVHQAKGREWPAVFLPALVKDRFPPRPRTNSIWKLIPADAIENSQRYDGSTEDERRLFYVAMTRSKKFLHMTYGPRSKGNWYRRESDFWSDVLVSKWVKRRKPDYTNRMRLPPQPPASVSNIEFSFSDLKYMFECAYQFKLHVLYGFNSPIVPPFGYGKSLHDALAEVHQRSMRGESVHVDDVPGLVERHLYVPYANDQLREQLKNAAHRDIANYIHDNADNFQHIEFSEQAVEIHLDDGVSIKGRIDLVRRTDKDETTIVDLKSNDRSQEAEVTDIQLHTYALGYRELTGRNADFVEVYELAERNAKPRSVDDEFISDVRREAQNAATALREMRLEPAPEVEICRRCDFSSICSARRI